jgi:hypothetical protein
MKNLLVKGKGYPYYTTGGPAEPSYSRDRACPCPGCDAASPRNRIRQQAPWNLLLNSYKPFSYATQTPRCFSRATSNLPFDKNERE